MEEVSFQLLVGGAVLLPFVAALLILVLRGRYMADAIGLVTAVTTATLCVLLVPEILAGSVPRLEWINLAPGIGFSWKVDALGLTFALLASCLWILVSIYSSGYVRASKLLHRPRFFASFAASIGAAVGIAFSANLLTFLLFFEILTLTTYPLVVHKESDTAISAGRRYIFFALSGGLAVTVGCAWIWSLTGNLDFRAGGFLSGYSPAIVSMLLILLVGGCGVKAAIMPMHGWLPAAMVAPSPVSALLHAVAVVKAGVFGCMRMIGFVIGPEALTGLWVADVLAGLCAATILIGSFIAIRQDNLKRRLAYSTVVHLNYIVLGAALLTSHGLTGSVLHMVNHGLIKITLFLCAGAIYATTHLEKVSQLKGLGRRMPYTCGAFSVAALALIGIPGLCGFPGKLFLAWGALDVKAWVYAATMLGASVLSGAYLIPIIKAFYFDKPEHEVQGGGEAPITLRIPLVITASLVVIFGILPPAINFQFNLAQQVTTAVYEGAP